MITYNAKIVVDLGNSETRVKTFCKNSKGVTASDLVVMDNCYAPVSDDKVSLYLTENTYNSDNSSLFRLDNGSCYCNGLLRQMEMSEISLRPTALEKKYDALISRLTLINAFKQGYLSVAKILGARVRDLNIDWELFLLLPPGDLDAGASSIAEMARGIKSIDFIIPKIENKPVKIRSINVFAEGLCAFFGVLYKSKGVIRQEYKYLTRPSESTIIFDIGAGTSDILLAKRGQIVQNSRYSREIGGNNIHSRVRRELTKKGIYLTDEAVREGVTTGYVWSGSRKIDITSYIEEAKDVVSYQLVDSVQEFFESSMINTRTIANVLVCGGGAEESDNPNIKSFSSYIFNYMRKIAPDIKVVEIPSTVNSDGSSERISPRLLNIIGAGILAE